MDIEHCYLHQLYIGIFRATCFSLYPAHRIQIGCQYIYIQCLPTLNMR